MDKSPPTGIGHPGTGHVVARGISPRVNAVLWPIRRIRPLGLMKNKPIFCMKEHLADSQSIVLAVECEALSCLQKGTRYVNWDSNRPYPWEDYRVARIKPAGRGKKNSLVKTRAPVKIQ